jgi:uncharacterized protein YutE (UPF0331/DUF86 family)/predicted nucleotidyltransferase
MINEEKLAQIFSGTDGIVAAYFFGSQVSGKTDAFSDYDFAVLLPADWSKDKRWTLVGELLDKAFAVVGQDRADVVDVSNQPLWFQQVVVQTGRVIYETDSAARREYERTLMHRCLEEGLPEYVGTGNMNKQDVEINFDTIEDNLEKLEILSCLSHDEFMADFRNLDAAVRRLQTSIEALVDISRYVIRSLGLPSADTYRQVPTVLADTGYLDETSTAIYDKMVRFRNLIVHHYYRVDPEDIYNILTENLSDLQNWRTTLLEIIEADANT